MTKDRVTELHVEGMRTLEKVRLRLDGLTVLIGENGSGKSSIVEAFELLAKAPRPDFLQAFNEVHGGLPNLLRFGAQRLTVGARIEGAGDGPLEYSVSLAAEGSRIRIVRETLDLWNYPTKSSPLHLLQRSAGVAKYFDRKNLVPVPEELEADLADGALLLSSFGRLPPNPGITRAVKALQDSEVHLAPDVRARWVRREHSGTSTMREASLLQPTARLSRLGGNLANCFHALKNDLPARHWRETMEFVRLGLGDDIESINTQSAPGGSQIALTMEIRGVGQQVPASAMSDGTLVFLAWVALSRLGHPSVVIVDEPELHLHPSLLVRVLGLFESMAQEQPVVLATHSDRLLDALADPASSVVLCRLDASRATDLRRPNKEALARWLDRYRGLGDLRGEGVEALVMTEPA